MPRPPDKDSKSIQLILKAKPEQESKVRWFKEWCNKNGREINEVLYEKIEEMARIHGYPDFHSQTTLDYSNQPRTLPRWKTCKYSSGRLIRGAFKKGEFQCQSPRDLHRYYKTPDRCDGCCDYREKELDRLVNEGKEAEEKCQK